MAKRVFLFLATNLAILLVLSIAMAVLQSFGILDFAGQQGTLLIFCLIYGFGDSARVAAALSYFSSPSP